MKAASVLLLIMAMILPFKGVAQRWGGGVDETPVHFGFLFQYVYAGYKAGLKKDWQTTNALGGLKGVTSPASGGWGLGLLADARINDNLNVRFTPTLIFSNRQVLYRYTDTTYIKGNQASLFGESAFLKSPIFDIPLSLKFSSDRKKNYKIYVLGGGKYSFEIVPEPEELTAVPMDMILKTKRSYFSFEAGVGIDLYLEYFKMTPEIKFSQSLHSLMGKSVHGNNNPFQQPVDKLFLQSIQFSLFFE